MTTATKPNIPLDKVADFCRKWKIQELSLFGSILRDDFRDDSDVDVLATFEPNDPWSYWEWPDLTDELEAIVGRKVDFVEKAALKNPYRRHEILRTARTIYVAGK